MEDAPPLERGVTVARTEDRMTQLRRTAATAEAFDLECELLFDERLRERDLGVDVLGTRSPGPFFLAPIGVLSIAVIMLASAIALDKVMTKRVWIAEGLPTPRYVRLSRNSDVAQAARDPVAARAATEYAPASGGRKIVRDRRVCRPMRIRSAILLLPLLLAHGGLLRIDEETSAQRTDRDDAEQRREQRRGGDRPRRPLRAFWSF